MLTAHFGIISALGSTAPTRAAPTLGMCWDHGIKRRGTSFHLVSRLLDLFPEWVICDGKLRKLLSGMPQAKPKLLSEISAGAGLTKDSALRILQAQEAKGSAKRIPPDERRNGDARLNDYHRECGFCSQSCAKRQRASVHFIGITWVSESALVSPLDCASQNRPNKI